MLEMARLERRSEELTGNLSGGWKQRLALGCAILHEPELLFLDEPTGGVDPKSRRMFWDVIYHLAEQGTTVMVTTHFMDEAEHCDKIGFIFEGSLIADDTPANLKSQLPGLLLQIPAADPLALVTELQAKESQFFDLYPYGTGVHALIASDQAARLAGYGGQTITPSLEDVFVYYVKSRQKEGEQ